MVPDALCCLFVVVTSEVDGFGRLPMFGLDPSTASSRKWAGLHELQLYVSRRGVPSTKDPTLTVTVDLLGL